MKPQSVDTLWRIAAEKMHALRHDRQLAAAQMGKEHPAVVSLAKEISTLADAQIELRLLKFTPDTMPSAASANSSGQATARVPWQERYLCASCSSFCIEPGAQERRICPECGGTLVPTLDQAQA